MAEWLATDTMQLDLAEQPKVMRVVGLAEADLPEIMIHDFRRNGYVPEVLNNFLALQGWSPGGDREQMTTAEMVELFSLDRINSANPKFNRDKLKSFSTDWFAKATPDRLLASLRDYLSVNPESPLTRATDAELTQLLTMNAGFHTLREVDEKSRFFFVEGDAVAYAPDAVEKVLRKNDGQGLAALRAVRPLLGDAAEWSAATLEAAVKAHCEQTGLGLGKVAQPIRVAVSGTAGQPADLREPGLPRPRPVFDADRLVPIKRWRLRRRRRRPPPARTARRRFGLARSGSLVMTTSTPRRITRRRSAVPFTVHTPTDLPAAVRSSWAASSMSRSMWTEARSDRRAASSWAFVSTRIASFRCGACSAVAVRCSGWNDWTQTGRSPISRARAAKLRDGLDLQQQPPGRGHGPQHVGQPRQAVRGDRPAAAGPQPTAGELGLGLLGDRPRAAGCGTPAPRRAGRTGRRWPTRGRRTRPRRPPARRPPWRPRSSPATPGAARGGRR